MAVLIKIVACLALVSAAMAAPQSLFETNPEYLDLEDSILEELPNAWTFTQTFSPRKGPLSDVIRNFRRKEEEVGKGRIAGGETVAPMEYPSTVLFVGANGNKCTGALLGYKYALVTRRCMIYNLTQPITAFAGEVNKGDFENSATMQSQSVIKITTYLPPGLNPLNYDIAVAEFESLFTASEHIAPVDVIRAEPANGTTLTITGWGGTDEIGDDSDTLQKLEVVTIPDVIRAHDVIFIEAEEPKGICLGDEGAPLYLEGQPRLLVGLMAFRTNRTSSVCTDGTPFGATSVVPYLAWMNCTVFAPGSCVTGGPSSPIPTTSPITTTATTTASSTTTTTTAPTTTTTTRPGDTTTTTTTTSTSSTSTSTTTSTSESTTSPSSATSLSLSSVFLLFALLAKLL